MIIRTMRKIQPGGYSYTASAYDQVQFIAIMRGALHVTPARGNCTLSQAIDVRPGHYVLLRHQSGFRLSCAGRTGYIGLGIVGLGEGLEHFRGMPVSGWLSGTLLVLVKAAWQHIQAPLPESAHVLRGLGEAILWEAQAQCRGENRTAAHDWAVAARAAIDINLGSGLPLRQVLQGIPVGYRHLYRCFHARYGKSPKHYQEEQRLAEAGQLLVDTDEAITTIGLELGFASSQHFATRFRHYFGQSPSRYRRAGRMVADRYS